VVKETTYQAVKAILKTDDSINAVERKLFLDLLRESPRRCSTQEKEPGDNILRRSEVAKLLSVSLRAIDQWAEEGILRKMKIPGRMRAIGFLRSDIERLLVDMK